MPSAVCAGVVASTLTPSPALALDQFGEAEIKNLRQAVAGDEQVLGLEIAMEDAPRVSGGKAAGDLHANLDRFASRERAAVEPLTQRGALEEFADDVRSAAVRANVEDSQNVRMVERGRRACLLFEAMKSVRVCGKRGGKNLDGDVASQPRVTGAIHLAHAPGAKEVDDFVRAEPGTRCERHRARL